MVVSELSLESVFGSGALRTRDADELPRMRCHQFLLIQACTSTFNTVQILIHLIRTVESDVEEDTAG